MPAKLKKGDISIQELYLLSKSVYKNKEIDNKQERMKLDIISAKVSKINNFNYDASTRTWKQSNKRHVKFEFIVKSKPVSYTKTDTINIHKYPVTILLYDFDLGMNSPFRFRSGSLKKPIFAPKGASSEKRLKITNTNIKNGVDLGFFFNLEWILKSYDLLYGVNYATRAPKVMNKELVPYFDKHTLFIVEKILPHFFVESVKGKIIRQLYKNEATI